MRYTPETLLSYLLDPRDRVLLMQNPVLPMPHYGALPPLTVGERRYVLARDGLYVQARNLAVNVCVRIADSVPLPFGELVVSIELVGGLLPHAFFERMRDEALQANPNEWAALVHWQPQTRRYEWTATRSLDRSAAHIQYDASARDESRLLLDVHSHGTAPAFFSATDDSSDAHGVYFASVLGRCDCAQRLSVRTRLVIDGLFIPLSWHPWQAQDAVADRASGLILEA